MPSVIAHYLLNQRLLGLMPDAFKAPGAKEAFLLGAQGPDVLFYAGQPSLKGKSLINKAGSRLHSDLAELGLEAMLQAVRDAESGIRPVQETYLKGYLCHYCLDRRLHPYVHWAADRLGDVSKTRTGGLCLHFRVETALDIILLRSETGQTILDFKPKTALPKCPEAEVFIADLYAKVIASLLRHEPPLAPLRGAFRSMRRALWFFYSPWGIKRGLFAFCERFVSENRRFYTALSHTVTEDLLMDYGNFACNEWKNPFTGESSLYSVLELFEETVAECLKLLTVTDEILEKGGESSCLSCGLMFSGEPLSARASDGGK